VKHAINPSTWEEEAGGSLSLRPTLSTFRTARAYVGPSFKNQPTKPSSNQAHNPNPNQNKRKELYCSGECTPYIIHPLNVHSSGSLNGIMNICDHQHGQILEPWFFFFFFLTLKENPVSLTTGFYHLGSSTSPKQQASFFPYKFPCSGLLCKWDFILYGLL
jgi:hypothetical protein